MRGIGGSPWFYDRYIQGTRYKVSSMICRRRMYRMTCMIEYLSRVQYHSIILRKPFIPPPAAPPNPMIPITRPIEQYEANLRQPRTFWTCFLFSPFDPTRVSLFLCLCQCQCHCHCHCLGVYHSFASYTYGRRREELVSLKRQLAICA